MGGGPALSLTHQTGGHYDFRPTDMPSSALTTDALSRQISDHLPLWVQFGTR